MKKSNNSQRKVVDSFKSKGIEIEVLNLEQSTKTSVEAAEVVGCKLEQIAKSIIFKDSNNNLIHIFVSGPNRVNFSNFEESTGIKLVNADAKFVRDKTGFAIGGVAPLGHIEEPIYFLDETLLKYDLVWCAGGTPNSLFKIKSKNLLQAINPKIVKLI
jgi:prolyl-tRNA editing enzyme YbaK/EbsC (Cys-tRNA(Pro) deacylase)|tara:strand:- start:95 stop:568 length:474 start_codon:yes stop_codon:yes gene_type:complete